MWFQDKNKSGEKGKDKRGVSELIAYVLLIVFAVIIAGIVYAWLVTYVPTESLNCPEGTSLFISSASLCNSQLILNVKNNGLFDLAGYFIHGSNSSTPSVSTMDLSSYFNKSVGFSSVLYGNSILFNSSSGNSFGPGNISGTVFNIPSSLGNITSIDIIPARFQVQNNRNRFVTCSNAKVTLTSLSCISGTTGSCTPDSNTTTCGTWTCGQKLNNCGTLVTCQPNNCAASGKTCSNGACISGTCTDTCASLGYTCGTWTICGVSVNCGPNNGQCSTGFQCNSTGQCIGINNDGICAQGETCSDPDCNGLQANCTTGNICISGSCQLTSGGSDCSNYCISLQHSPAYTSGPCVSNNGQCNSKGGQRQSGGDGICASKNGGSLPDCCCLS